MIYYPLSTLMEFNIKDILIIVKPDDLKQFKSLLGNGEQFGIKIYYKTQIEPKGIAESFLIGKKFIGNNNVCLILGDNIFHGIPYNTILPKNSDFEGAKIILYRVQDPERYGVVKFNKKRKIIKIIEKPKNFISNYAVTGIYFYDKNVIKYANKLKPSNRNELEITDINNYYVDEKKLDYFTIKPGGVWLDAGTEKSLLQSSTFIQTMQERQNIQISSPEIIAYKKGWITKKKLINSISDIKNAYTSFLRNL
tara:strand:- start:3089 stop:3844 length:756 start_codon:yes stop_codon:yes gene_type:complete